MDLWFKNDREAIVVGAFGVILKTDDGGNNWAPIIDRIKNPNSSHLNSITQCRDSLYIAGEFGLLFRSDDFGQNWKSLKSPFDGSLFGIIGNPEENTVIAFGLRGKIFYSNDKGESWMPAINKGESALIGGTLLSNGSFCLVGNSPSPVISVDGGKTFLSLPLALPPSTSIIEAKNGNLVIVGARGAFQIKPDALNPKITINKGKLQ